MIVAAWGISVAQDREPGPGVSPPHRVPAAFAAGVPGDGPLALVAVHPRCPCSRATAEQLMVARTQYPSLRVAVILRQPAAAPAWPTPAEVERLVGAGAHLTADPGGSAAAGLGLHTSGAVALYDATGRRVFSGGLTAGRGAHGPAASFAAFLAAAGGEPAPGAFAVFGCPINDDTPCTTSACPPGPACRTARAPGGDDQ